MRHYRCLTSYIPKTFSEDMTEFFPMLNQLPCLEPEDVVIPTVEELTEALHNPVPPSPIPNLGLKQTVTLRQLAYIFNTDVPQTTPTSPVQLPRVELKPAPPHWEGLTQQLTITVLLDPAPHQRANTNTQIAMNLGCAKMQPPETEPHINPDDTKVIPPDMQQYEVHSTIIFQGSRV